MDSSMVWLDRDETWQHRQWGAGKRHLGPLSSDLREVAPGYSFSTITVFMVCHMMDCQILTLCHRGPARGMRWHE